MRIFSILALVLCVACADANSGAERVSVALSPTEGGRVFGTAILTSTGDGTNVAVRIRGLRPNEDVLGVFYAGDCNEHGASPLALPRLKADGAGQARAYGPLLYRGREDVAISNLADGHYAVRIIGRGELACGVVPAL